VLTYRTGDGLSIAVRDLTTGEEIRHTGTFYNWPMVLGDSQYAIDDLSPGREQVRVYAYIGELEATNPPAPGTGCAWMTDHYVTNDQNRFTQLIPYGILNPHYAGPLFCGEAQDGGVGLVDQPSQKKLIVNAGQNTYEPRIAQYAPDKWAVVTGDYTTVTLIYDITQQDITGTAYNPKPDLIALRADLDGI